MIQCAAGKDPSAGHMMTEKGQPVVFVADPQNAPSDKSVIYKRPDDPARQGFSWREMLIKYNREHKDSSSHNPLGLLPAWRLYRNPAYGELFSAFGAGNVFILSAGWGLIPAGFLTPYYDITFSPSAKGANAYKRRRAGDRYKDFSMLGEDTTKPVVFLGGKDYVPLFCLLTQGIRSERTIFFNSKTPPPARGCRLLRFPTEAKTNWHYGCARELARGNLIIS